MRRKHGRIANNQTLLLLDLLSFALGIFLSGALCGNAFFGASVFIAGSSARSLLSVLVHRQQMGNGRPLIGAVLVAAAAVLLASAFSLLLALSSAKSTEILAVGALMALLALRSALSYETVHWFADRRKTCLWVMALSQAALTAALIVLLARFAGGLVALAVGALACVQPVFLFVWLLRARNRPLVEELHVVHIEAASFRLYSSLRLCSEVSFYLSLMAYTGMLVLVPVARVSLLPLALLVALLVALALLTGRSLHTGRLSRAEKSSLFLIGGFVWLFARLRMNEGIAHSDALFWLWMLVQATGLGIMLLQVRQMQQDMKLVLELADEGDEAALRSHQYLYGNLAFLVAGILMSAELYLLSLFVENRTVLGITAPDRATLVWILSALPMVFVGLSMIFALAQPLNRDIVRKLRLYHEQRQSRSIIPELENRLKRLLVARYRKRMGAKLLALALKPFFYHRIADAKNVPLADGPVAFVANHREIYGPLILNLYLPFTFRPWIENRMLEPGEIRDFLWQSVFAAWKHPRFARFAHRIVCAFAVWLLNSLEPIPVYRGTLREVLKTMEQSVIALQEQDNLLIFPENPQKSGGKYAQEGISPFFTGFVAVAKHYYKKTGKILSFVPVYAQPKRRTLSIGKPVAYDPQGTAEGERVCEALMQAMTELAK